MPGSGVWCKSSEDRVHREQEAGLLGEAGGAEGAPAKGDGLMATFLVREIIDGKMVGGPIEASSREEAEKIFKKKLPALKRLAAELPETGLEESPAEVMRPEANKKLNGKKFLGLEFQCSACGVALAATFKDGYLQIDPCPTCLGELENMVAASKRFLERKK